MSFLTGVVAKLVEWLISKGSAFLYALGKKIYRNKKIDDEEKDKASAVNKVRDYIDEHPTECFDENGKLKDEWEKKLREATRNQRDPLGRS